MFVQKKIDTISTNHQEIPMMVWAIAYVSYAMSEVQKVNQQTNLYRYRTKILLNGSLFFCSISLFSLQLFRILMRYYYTFNPSDKKYSYKYISLFRYAINLVFSLSLCLFILHTTVTIPQCKTHDPYHQRLWSLFNDPFNAFPMATCETQSLHFQWIEEFFKAQIIYENTTKSFMRSYRVRIFVLSKVSAAISAINCVYYYRQYRVTSDAAYLIVCLDYFVLCLIFGYFMVTFILLWRKKKLNPAFKCIVNVILLLSVMNVMFSLQFFSPPLFIASIIITMYDSKLY
eukprot:1937_1